MIQGTPKANEKVLYFFHNQLESEKERDVDRELAWQQSADEAAATAAYKGGDVPASKGEGAKTPEKGRYAVYYKYPSISTSRTNCIVGAE